MHGSRFIVLVALLIGCSSCRQSYPQDPPPDAAPLGLDASSSWPRDDLVPAIGTPGGLDVGTWNIENFPQGSLTEELVASIVLSLELDLIGVQEIADEAAFADLMALLPEYRAVLSTHTYGNGSYQKVGFIYRSGLLTAGDIDLLYYSDSYAFPRPPMAVDFTVRDPDSGQFLFDFTAVVVHLKAGVDSSDRDRRRSAMRKLDDYMRERMAGPEDSDVVLLGDFNESFDSATSLAVWAPLLDAPAQYQVHTTALAAGEFSLVPFARLVDHVVTTTTLSGSWVTEVEIPRLDLQINTYLGSVSDHLPVVTSVTGLW